MSFLKGFEDSCSSVVQCQKRLLSSGKTTTMRMITGVINPDGGRASRLTYQLHFDTSPSMIKFRT